MLRKELKCFVVFTFLVLFQRLADSLKCGRKCGIPSEWLPVARNICYGTDNNEFANFTVNRDCHLYKMRLSHVSGFQNGWKEGYNRSRWGYNANPCCMTWLCTIVLKNGKPWFPDDYSHFYTLDGYEVNDDVITFKKNETLTAGTKLQVAFGFDYENVNKGFTEGTHCVDIDISCMVRRQH